MARYLCAQCGKPGIREEAFTQIDERYAFGACSGAHEGRQLLVREDQPLPTKRKRKG